MPCFSIIIEASGKAVFQIVFLFTKAEISIILNEINVSQSSIHY